MYPRAKNGAREAKNRDRQKEGERKRATERAIRKEREKAREKEMCSINIFSVLLCSLLVFLFNLPYLSSLLERGKLWNENICTYLSIPRYIVKAEKKTERERESNKERERERK